MTYRIVSIAAASAVTLALSGCGVATPSASPTPVTSSPASSPATPTLTAEQMTSAPVPSLCGQPAGNLTNGTIGTPGKGKGGGSIATYGADAKPAFLTWQGGGGAPLGALVITCDAAGATWPQHVVFYSTGPSVLGQIDVSSVVGKGHQGVVDMSTLTTGVRLSLTSTSDTVADFTWDGTKASGTVVKKLNEKPAAKEAFFAALAGDKAAIAKLYTADGKAEALDFKNNVVLPDAKDWSTTFSCDAASKDKIFAGKGRKYDRVCYFGAKDAYVIAVVAMKHTGFGTWQSAGVQSTTTD